MKKYFYVVATDGYDGMGGAVGPNYSNREAAEEAAKWYNEHPEEAALCYGLQYEVRSLNIPDELLDEFTPPMTDEEYQKYRQSLLEDEEYRQYMKLH